VGHRVCEHQVAPGFYDLHLTLRREHSARDPAGDDRAAPGDRANALDGHHERSVEITPRLRKLGATITPWIGFASAGVSGTY
jgi:hypothetical protein